MITRIATVISNIVKGLMSAPIPYPFPEPSWLDYVNAEENASRPKEPKTVKVSVGRKFSNGFMESKYNFGELAVGESFKYVNTYNEPGDDWYKRIQAAASAYGRYNDKQLQTRYKNVSLLVTRIR